MTQADPTSTEQPPIAPLRRVAFPSAENASAEDARGTPTTYRATHNTYRRTAVSVAWNVGLGNV